LDDAFEDMRHPRAFSWAMLHKGDRFGGNSRYPTVEDAVAICENGLGYE
jgi:hypothetical protein